MTTRMCPRRQLDEKLRIYACFITGSPCSKEDYETCADYLLHVSRPPRGYGEELKHINRLTPNDERVLRAGR